MALPDVDTDSWTTFSAARFKTRTSERVAQLQGASDFVGRTNARISGLGYEPVEVANPNSPLITGGPGVVIPPIRTPAPPTLPPLPTPVPGAPPLPAPPQIAPPLPGPSLPGTIGQPDISVPGALPRPAPPPVAPTPPSGPTSVQVLPQAPVLPGGQPVAPTSPTFAPDQTMPGQASPFATQQTSGAAAAGGDLRDYARQAANRAGIDPDLFVAQIQQESGFNPTARSSAGAQGIAQIVPRWHPGVNPSDPYASLDYAANLMKSHLNTYGGDYAHALIAYNGGGGAVQAWDRGDPYAESQKYVSTILGSQRPNAQTLSPSKAGSNGQMSVATVSSRPTVFQDISQFGDRELTAAEAYAACGPAAAARFAQFFGRNPTLREATDLAATVGWTPDQGMAGITSEQALLKKMGVETKLVGRNWGDFAREAQTGNPVAISTPGHYFFVDGFNPQNDTFHVGRSGLDLKGGSEWMTADQIESRMGTAQGALFTNMPTVAGSSVTAPTAPRSLDDTRQAITNSFRPTVPPRSPTADPQIRQLDQAIELTYIPDEQRQQPDERARTQPFAPAMMGAGMPPPGPPGGNPFDQFGQTMANALKSLLGGGGPPGGRRDGDQLDEEDRLRSGNRIADPNADYGQLPPGPVEIPDIPLGERRRPGLFDERTQAMIDRFQTLPGGRKISELAGTPDLIPPDISGKSPEEAILDAARRAGEQAMNRQSPTLGPGGLGIFDPRLGGDPRMDVPGGIDPLEKVGDLVRWISRRGEGTAGVRALDEAFKVARAELPISTGVTAGAPSIGAGAPVLREMAADGARSISDGLERNGVQGGWDNFVRGYSDRNVDLNHISEDLQRRLDRPLTDSENLALLARFDPTHQAEQATEMAIGPALRNVPRKAQADLYDLIKHRTNLSIAEGLGTREERTFLEGGIAPSTEQRLESAMSDLVDATQTHAQARSEQLMVERGGARTRESISLDAAQRRTSEAEAQLDAAAEVARQAQAEAAGERVRTAPGARVQTVGELKDLTVAEANAQRLNQQYERLFQRNPDSPYLFTLGRQVGRAEDRAARLRAQLGERSATREEAIGARAQAASEAAAARPGITPTPQSAAANVRLRYEQQNLARLQREQARGRKGLADDVARAQKRVDKAQADVDQAWADMPAAAAAQGQAVREGRSFEGMRYPDIQAAVGDLEKKYAKSPETWKAMQDAAQAVFDYRKVLLQEKVDAGLITQDTADALLDLYKEWTPTRMLAYMADEGTGGLARGNRVNVNSNGFRNYTLEGTDLPQENHVASLIREADQTHALGAKNRVFNALINAQGGEGGALRKIADNMDEYMAAGGPDGPLLRPDYPVQPGNKEFKLTGFVDGKKQEYVTSNAHIKQAVENAAGTPDDVTKAANKLTSLVRETAVSRNPLWLAGQVLWDAAGYGVTTTARGGVRGNLGSTALNLAPALITARTTSPDDPKRGEKIAAAAVAGIGSRAVLGNRLGLGPSALRELMVAYGDVLQGLGTGRMTGEGVRELMGAGAGMRGGGFQGGTVAGAERRLEEITRPNAFSLRPGTADATKLFSDAAAFGWVKALGNRFEQAPRLAAYRVSRQQGETQLQAMARARDVTLDFDRGGNFSKALNGWIPFFNAGAQAGAQFTRLAKQNPGGLALAGISLVGMPTVMAEIWNRSDPQRSKDYDNVPEYIKKQGPVLMLPGEAPVDKNGNRVPQHIDINVREFAPFAIAAREAFNRLPQETIEGIIGQPIVGQGAPQGAGEIAAAVGGQLSPLNARNMLDATFGILPPPISTVGSLASNRDLFRGTTIANQYSDENASAFGKWLAPHIEGAVTGLPGQSSFRARPSQVDFAMRDLFNGVGSMALGASDVVTGRPPRAPGLVSDIPVVGSEIGRFIRGTGGQARQDVTEPDVLMKPDVRHRLRALGDYYEPSLVQDTIQKIPLRQVEQVEYQRLTNEYFDRNVRRFMNMRAFENPLVRETLIRQAMTNARDLAQAKVLTSIRKSGSSLAKRVRADSSAY